ncbi:MAG: aminotransferase class I/II-fold pyridoxal phosphate-dependent enzyme, partial [Muribaculaceae bacterium]|nr:aminotransferase class I/II-fold pyridoxal phosphate-dependent enzyme [Muribaculaceae bacterium]
LERCAAGEGAAMILLCNPHNPGGRVWTREELEKIDDVATRHGLVVVSDEIHCELTFPGQKYIPYSTLGEGARSHSVSCVSPSKAFNTAGLQIANIVTHDPVVAARIDRAINDNEVCDVNPFGVEALKAAYTSQGAAWLDSLRSYIHDNYRLTCETMQHELPQYPISKLEATYLPWIDVSASGLASSELENRLKHEAKVWLNSGEMYGDTGYLRLNIACRRSVLAEGLRRMTGYLKRL